jgi:sugar/nucleoside kinase (ribokinase family)
VRPVAVIGNLASDVVDGGSPRVGGAPFYAARALHALARPALILTKLAERDRGSLLPPLVALGVPVFWRPATTTTQFGIRYHGDDRTMTIDDLGEPWTPDDVRGWVADALGETEWVQVAPLAGGEFPAETLGQLGRGRRLLLDGQGLVRPARTGPLELSSDPDPNVLSSITALKLSEEEALALVGSLDEAALSELGVPEVIVTLASRGALVLADGRLTPVPTRPAREPYDPTGAGDAFAAAYVVARSVGQTPVAAARRANALAGALLEGRPI